MIEYKQSVTAKAPVRIVDSSGNPVAGVAFGSVTATAMKSDGTTTAITVTSLDWAEITTGAFTSQGFYTMSIAGSVLNTTGLLTYAVASGSNKTYVGAIKVVANEEVDTYGRVGAPAGASISADIASVKSDSSGLRTDYTTGKAAYLDASIVSRASQTSVNSIAVDTSGLRTDYTTGKAAFLDAAISSRAQASDLTSIATDVATLLKHAEGRWKIHLTGLDANRLVIYDTDDTTPIIKFDLKDPSGAPTYVYPFERVKVP
jgi:hypothetical protein